MDGSICPGGGDLIPNEGVWKRKMTVEAEIEMFLYEMMWCFPQNNFKQTGNINLVLKCVAIPTNMAQIQLLSALDNIIYFHLHVGSDCGITCMEMCKNQPTCDMQYAMQRTDIQKHNLYQVVIPAPCWAFYSLNLGSVRILQLNSLRRILDFFMLSLSNISNLKRGKK